MSQHMGRQYPHPVQGYEFNSDPLDVAPMASGASAGGRAGGKLHEEVPDLVDGFLR